MDLFSNQWWHARSVGFATIGSDTTIVASQLVSRILLLRSASRLNQPRRGHAEVRVSCLPPRQKARTPCHAAHTVAIVHPICWDSGSNCVFPCGHKSIPQSWFYSTPLDVTNHDHRGDVGVRVNAPPLKSKARTSYHPFPQSLKQPALIPNVTTRLFRTLWTDNKPHLYDPRTQKNRIINKRK